MTAQTELSYGYTQPVTEGEYYTLYHGFMEARPVSETTSKLIYTTMWDTSQDSEDKINADIERRRNTFTTGVGENEGNRRGGISCNKKRVEPTLVS